MKKNLKNKKYILLTLAGMTGLLSSCSTEEEISGKGPEVPIRISASIAASSPTRAYQASGKVETGRFYLTYSNPSGEPAYQVGEVNFYDGTGFVTDSEPQELTWAKVGFDPGGDDKNATFRMDNFSSVAEDPAATTITLNPNNPYKAGKFDYVNGTNDLLWGMTTVTRMDPKVAMRLHHAMAMLRIIVVTDASAKGSSAINLERATVEITNIVNSPVSYDRLTGTLLLPEEEAYSDLKIIQPGTSEWTAIETEPENDEITTYTAPDFVLPPQGIAQGESRPRLRITVPQDDGGTRVFSGPLPRAMVVEAEDGSTVSMNFSFLREHIMTLRVTMDPDLMNLEFMPVTVTDWVDKGTFVANGSQSAIFDADNFMDMIKWYNAGDWTSLQRLGYLDQGQWIFNIYGDLILNESEILGRLEYRSDNPIAFKFNGQTVTVIRTDGTVLELTEENDGPEELLEIIKSK